MASLDYGSSDLLMRFNREAGRPSTDSISPDVKYSYLADAQQYVLMRIASIDPKVLYGEPQAMFTDDGGLTYTFNVGGTLFPLGRARIYPNVQSIPGYALRPGFDYLDEGVRIRAVNASPIAPPLIWYGLDPIGQMSGTIQPVLQPPPIRMLIVIKAVSDFAESALRNVALSDRMLVRFEREFGPNMTMLRTHFQRGGAMGRLLGPYGVPYSGTFAGYSI